MAIARSRRSSHPSRQASVGSPFPWINHASQTEDLAPLTDASQVLLAIGDAAGIPIEGEAIDSLSELRLLAQGALRFRRQILALKQFFAGRNCTVLLLDDQRAQPEGLQLHSIVHGVIALEQLIPEYGSDRRRPRHGDLHHEVSPVPCRRGVPIAVGLYHVAVQLADWEAVKAAHALLSERGLLKGTADHGVSKSLYTTDPDGNEIELYCDAPRSEWEGRVDRAMTVRPLELD